MRGMNSETIDLIYLDPPYNSERIYKGKIPNQEFGDIWRKDILKKYEIDLLEIDYPEINKILDAVKTSHSEGMYYYLVFMFIRLVEMERILKPTGSIYLHCDKHANAYIRILLDAVFGKNNFINEIIWCYKGPGNVRKRMPQKHDTIFAYSKTKNYTFNPCYVDYSPQGAMNYTKASFTTGERTKEEVEQLDVERTSRGKKIEDWWSDIGSGGHIPKSELTGWSTQKPRKLLDRIIRIATNENDIVFDPFSGCGTTIATCIRMARDEDKEKKVVKHKVRFVGCDIDEAFPYILMNRNDLSDLLAKDFPVWSKELPVRDDIETLIDYSKLAIAKRAPVRKWYDCEIYAKQDGRCAISGKRIDYLAGDIDHIKPLRQGGSNDIENLQFISTTEHRRKTARENTLH